MSSGAGWSLAVTAMINTLLLWIRLFLTKLFSVSLEVSYTHHLLGFFLPGPPPPLLFSLQLNHILCSVVSPDRSVPPGSREDKNVQARVLRLCVAFCSSSPIASSLCTMVSLRGGCVLSILSIPWFTSPWESRCYNPLVSPNWQDFCVCFPPPIFISL